MSDQKLLVTCATKLDEDVARYLYEVAAKVGLTPSELFRHILNRNAKIFQEHWQDWIGIPFFLQGIGFNQGNVKAFLKSQKGNLR